MKEPKAPIEQRLAERDLYKLRKLMRYLEDRRGEMLFGQSAGNYEGNKEAATRRFFTFIDLSKMVNEVHAGKMLEPITK